jgi:hypothetical protein
MSNNFYQKARQTVTGTTPSGRTQKRIVEFSGELIDLNSVFSIENHTYQDPSGEIVSIQMTEGRFLACGCKLESPGQLRICPSCAKKTLFRGRWKTVRLICNDKHKMCLWCSRTRARRMEGGGFFRKLGRLVVKVILWPLGFDVSWQ